MSTSVLQQAEQRWLNNQTPSDASGSSLASERSPTATPTTTPTASPVDPSPSALDAFLAEVDEWLVRTNRRMAELERRHQKHFAMEVVVGEWVSDNNEAEKETAESE